MEVPNYGCEGVLVEVSTGRCSLKRHIQPSECPRDGNYDLYLRVDHRPPASATPLIVDSDLSFDVDDVGAICIAHALHDLGEAKLLAVMHNSGYPAGIGAASVLNHYYGHDDIALGAYKGSFGRFREDMEGVYADMAGDWVTGDYVPRLVANWPSPVKNSGQVADAVDLYRRLLAQADDHSIVIAAIGFTTNLALLLRSAPDNSSSLSGFDLVAKKIKTVVYQGGWYPTRHPWKVLEEDFNWGCGKIAHGPAILFHSTCLQTM